MIRRAVAMLGHLFVRREGAGWRETPLALLLLALALVGAAHPSLGVRAQDLWSGSARPILRPIQQISPISLPAAGSWLPLPTAGAAGPRTGHTAIWTGREMIIWGGTEYGTVITSTVAIPVNTGARYNPETNRWAPLPTKGAPGRRTGHTAVWTGAEMLVWGGAGEFGSWGDGARYDPAGDSWTPITTTGAPAPRSGHVSVWTGTEMLVWGGAQTDEHGITRYLSDGARYDPVTDRWSSMSTLGSTGGPGLPAVWTGAEMIVPGHGRYDPVANRWTSIASASVYTGPGSTAIWTGEEVIVRGYSTTGRYNPATNAWVQVPGDAASRSGHSAVWTGREMLVWGGYQTVYSPYYSGSLTNSGLLYDPTTNIWRSTQTTNAPGPRQYHTAVWTGSEMIVWGGSYYPATYSGSSPPPTTYLNDGGRYVPDVAPHQGGPDAAGYRFANNGVADGPIYRWDDIVQSGTVITVFTSLDDGHSGPVSLPWGFPFYGQVYDHLYVSTNGYLTFGQGSGQIPGSASLPAPAQPLDAIFAFGHDMVIRGDTRVAARWLTSPDRFVVEFFRLGYYSSLGDTGARTTLEVVLYPDGQIVTQYQMTTGENPRIVGIQDATGSAGLTYFSGRGHTVFGKDGQGKDGVKRVELTPGKQTVGFPPQVGLAIAYRPATTGGTPVPTATPTVTPTPTVTSTPTLSPTPTATPSRPPWQMVSDARAPSARYNHTAVWTGTEMLVWGGYDGFGYLANGARYDPTADTWTPITTTGAPSARQGQTAVWTGTEMIVWGGYNSNSWPNTLGGGARYNPTTDTWTPITTTNAPSGRYYHTAVWTGTEMIIWGGYGNSYPYHLSNGARYNPTTDTWTPIATAGAPSARQYHTAVWTGTEMIVWGGYNGNYYPYYLSDGARYDPTTDTWTPLTAGGAPAARQYHTAMWTGTEMIVWGGYNGNSYPYYRGDGARYDPTTDTWTPLGAAGAPGARQYHTAIWTGTEMIVWGGYNDSVSPYYLSDGARYNPATDSWATIVDANAPRARSNHTSVWTGAEMIVWGGRDGSGSLGDGAMHVPPPVSPSTPGPTLTPTPVPTLAPDTWSALPTARAPTARAGSTAIWTGAELIVWGGEGLNQWGSCCYPLGDGARYSSTTSTWRAMRATGAPGARQNHAAVWTGTEMIVWGGSGLNQYGSCCSARSDGARYNPTADTWSPITTTGAPSSRYDHTAIWTGTELLVWGGNDGYSFLANGARYNPTTNIWTPITTTGAPSSRSLHTAIWTGSEMIVWGGYNGNTYPYYRGDGARYDPATDTWSPIATAGAPSARRYHTAVWTGTEMILWGGYNGNSYPYYRGDGARYDPATDTWSPIATAGAPSARQYHTAVWTDGEMIVWGGSGNVSYLGDGGRYRPATDEWQPIKPTVALTGRERAAAAWTGTELIVWGGYGRNPSSSCCYPLGDGARYRPPAVLLETPVSTRTATPTATPVLDSWVALSSTGAPTARQDHTTVWAGSEMLVWGGYGRQSDGTLGYLGGGGRYDPATNRWQTLAMADAPSPRSGHAGIWTGAELLVWGGHRADTDPAGHGWVYLGDGGRYGPVADIWSPITTTGAPAPRTGHAAAWTGVELLVWGGYRYDGGDRYLSDGARYNPTTDTWTPIAATGAPGPRTGHAAVWTGAELIVWGGYRYENGWVYLNDGGRYNPATDTWTPLTDTGAPGPRAGHRAVWTGAELIVWGGRDRTRHLGDGGRYNPVTNTWTAIATWGAADGREGHGAVWTGTELIVWGGYRYANGDVYLRDGGRYRPATDSWSWLSLATAPSTRSQHSAVWTGTELIVWGGYNGAWLGNGARYAPGESGFASVPTPTAAPNVTATATATVTLTATRTPNPAVRVKNVRVANVADTSATIAWETTGAATGSVVYAISGTLTLTSTFSQGIALTPALSQGTALTPVPSPAGRGVMALTLPAASLPRVAGDGLGVRADYPAASASAPLPAGEGLGVRAALPLSRAAGEGPGVRTAPDIRGPSFSGDTHYVVLTGLSPATTYQFLVDTDGALSDSAAPSSFTTGPDLGLPAAPNLLVGHLLEEEAAPAPDCLLFVRLGDGDGTGSAGDSAWLASLSDLAGDWQVELQARAADLQSYFDYQLGADSLLVEARCGARGSARRSAFTSLIDPDTAVGDLGDLQLRTLVTEPLTLIAGWNLIALPVRPNLPSGLLAEDLGQLLVGQAITTSQVVRWNEALGAWSAHLVGRTSNNFAIDPTRGYFVRVSGAGGTASFTGSPLEEPTTVTGLVVGWNLLAVPYPTTLVAEDLGQGMLQRGLGATQVVRWNEALGTWSAHLVGRTSNNFAIERGHGYFVRVSSVSGAGEFTP